MDNKISPEAQVAELELDAVIGFNVGQFEYGNWIFQIEKSGQLSAKQDR
ncbi:CFAP52 isoform 6 [Pongo abelii]|uniref:CFAP52 isoform 6 n=1 Tax=Pongo abelii TaxID=9601 RepID=A0A2J8TF93_PONAB|nr:CFAP52 isoform 6 [Pongo abelii]